jgi:hypothetical protein
LFDDEGNESILSNNIDAYANLLNIITSSKNNNEIEDELLNLVGFHNIDLLQ